jgi:hypothetical protein
MRSFGGIVMLCRFLCCAGLALGASAGEARAAALSYISVAGVNSGDCSDPKTPCRTLSYALTKTSSGGEIKTLLPGNYGTASIKTGVTLTGVPGSLIMVGAGDTTGLFINALSTDSVVIDGFTLNGQGGASIGVRLTKAGQFIMKNCTVKNFRNWGVELGPTAATKFSIEDSFIANTTYGVYLHKSANGSNAGVIHRSTIIGNGAGGIGVAVMGSSRVRVSDSLIGHAEYGIYVGNGSGNALRITRNTISQNQNGVSVEKNIGAVAETGKDNFIAGNSVADIDTTFGAPLTDVGTQ